MCGFAGFFQTEELPGLTGASDTVRNMIKCLRPRGPDDEGYWSDQRAGLSLGHCRLSIIDTSSSGHQPMISPDGRYALVYNGEIYNFRDLQSQLENTGWTFKGSCDSEVLLAACATWGVEAAVGKCNGMFAFAFWDRETRTLTLARDRLGIKPLVWGHADNAIMFASQTAALRAHPGWTPRINRQALCLYMRLGYVPAPFTIYDGIFKLPAGHLITIRDGVAGDPTPYWQAAPTQASSQVNDIDQLVGDTHKLLRDAVSNQLVSDVPLGSFLSGGVDSTLVTALMHEVAHSPVKTFSIGFNEQDYDESPHAAAIAKHLGSDHHEIRVSAADVLDIIPTLPDFYDEPFADASALPTALLCKGARNGITVALSGDGGDEVFSGYNRYHWGEKLRRLFLPLPHPLRRSLAAMIRALPPTIWDKIFMALRGRLTPPLTGNTLHKLAAIAKIKNVDELYTALVSQWDQPTAIVQQTHDPFASFLDSNEDNILTHWRDRARLLDIETYLPGDILTKVDRASMASSLEVRVPLLDHRLIEASWQWPISDPGVGKRPKWLAREILSTYIPDHLVDRPKQGFAVPIDHWLRGPLRDWAESLLDKRRLDEDGHLYSTPIEQAWKDHLSGRHNRQYQLWTILMFQAWKDRHHPGGIEST